MKSSSRLFAPPSSTPCTRTHQIGALALITITFFTTRLLDQSLSTPSTSHFNSNRFQYDVVQWPSRGYGSDIDLKIYVYDENEIDGVKELLYGRDGKITAESCLKGQWGTQVKIHKLFLKSRFRTHKKEDADLFFVPSYVKCVRMMGGLNDKEINQAYVKGDRTDKRDTSAFNTWKDIIIPGNVDDGMTTNGVRLVEPLPLSKRKYLANYLGRAQGKIGRLQLIDLAKQFPDKECVPVLLSDHAELPFQNVVDYSQISIKWPSSRISTELLEYLESIPGVPKDGLAVVKQGLLAGRIPGLSEPNEQGWRTYRRPDEKSGGHGVGWSPIIPYIFQVPDGWEEIDLRFSNTSEGRLFVIVAPVLRFADYLEDDARIEKIGPPEKVINAFGPEVIGENVEGKVVNSEVKEYSGRKYYQFELEPPHCLITATAAGNRLYLFSVLANGLQWKRHNQDLKKIADSFRVV
ncbi:hypothetical protein M8C21_018271 [Ambrosia artemisiifolia]|uniref:PsbP C-terminal domain-containing protein n=1 Tax=Ambrosia artemisiifolia TaxID=4212 RepID=A0AAD5GHJ0_AMBAR|nr:hypothetical protein M8C21_018271 [Ambrosia artemisiifolia]